jgi:acetolactate synthase-1/2/3 large subunit
LLGKDSFQEVDIAGVTMPITKHGYIVKDVNKLADTIRKAFKIAKSGRPGPVLVDITKDVTANKCEFVPKKPEAPEIKNDYTKADIDVALELIKNAKKPYIYLGGGAIISGASREVKEFAEKIQAPVCDTLMGKGAFDGYNELYTGMIGMHGTKASNLGVSQCDLLIALGARFSDRVIGNPKRFAENAKILHIDIDAAEVNKNIKTTASIIGDLKTVLKELNSKLEPQRHDEWIATIKELKAKYPLKYESDKLTCPYIIEELDRVTKGKAIVSTDVGQHQMWAAQYYRYTEPRTFLSSGGLGTMGYGLGACIGAKVGRPDKICVNIAGDGCFRMNMNELATASRYNIPIIQIIINNHVLGMVRQWQTLFYGQRYSQTVLTDKVDFCKVSEGLGCEAIRVTKREEVAPAIEKAISLNKPVVIECIIEEDDKVFPMVPAGAPISDAFDADDLSKRQ